MNPERLPDWVCPYCGEGYFLGVGGQFRFCPGCGEDNPDYKHYKGNYQRKMPEVDGLIEMLEI